MQALDPTLTTRLVNLASRISDLTENEDFRARLDRRAKHDADWLAKESNAILEELKPCPYPDGSDFEPVNGTACVVGMHHNRNLWRVTAIASNWPQQHHPIAVGDVLVLAGGIYLHGSNVGMLRWVHPKDIAAVHRKTEQP